MRVLIVSEGRSELDGALEALVRQLTSVSITCETGRVSDRKLGRFFTKGPGHFKRALRWMLQANKQGYDAIVLVIDQDGDPDRRSQIEQAQKDTRAEIQRAFGVAVQKFDAWMLADETAIGRLTGKAIERQPDPESLSDPKAQCQKLHEDHALNLGLGKMYAEIAAEIDLVILEHRCPKGFAPFASRVRNLHQTS